MKLFCVSIRIFFYRGGDVVKKSNHRTIKIALFPFLLVLLVGCTEKTVKDTDPYIQPVEAVLQNALNGPKEELKEIWNKQKESKIDGEEMQAALGGYEEKAFKDYFSNQAAYNDFISRYGTILMMEPYKKDYSLEVKNIEYERTDSKEKIYNFSISLAYYKKGMEEPEVKKVTGQANVNADFRIERMLIRVNDLWGSFDKKK